MSTNNRGHETGEHRALKAAAAGWLEAAGFDPVLIEHGGCDVVAVRRDGEVLAVEVERSKRNLLRNLERNFAQGGRSVWVITPDFASAAEVARAVSRHVPAAQQGRIALATSSILQLLRPSLPH